VKSHCSIKKSINYNKYFHIILKNQHKVLAKFSMVDSLTFISSLKTLLNSTRNGSNTSWSQYFQHFRFQLITTFWFECGKVYPVPKENGHFSSLKLTAAAVQRPNFPHLASRCFLKIRRSSVINLGGRVWPLHCPSRQWDKWPFSFGTGSICYAQSYC